jgi:hypothetical protein
LHQAGWSCVLCGPPLPTTSCQASGPQHNQAALTCLRRCFSCTNHVAILKCWQRPLVPAVKHEGLVISCLTSSHTLTLPYTTPCMPANSCQHASSQPVQTADTVRYTPGFLHKPCSLHCNVILMCVYGPQLADAAVRIPFDFQRFLKTQPPKIKDALLKTPKGNEQIQTTPLLPNLLVTPNTIARWPPHFMSFLVVAYISFLTISI